MDNERNLPSPIRSADLSAVPRHFPAMYGVMSILHSPLHLKASPSRISTKIKGLEEFFAKGTYNLPGFASINKWMCKHLGASPYIIAAYECNTSASTLWLIFEFPVEIKFVGSYLHDLIGVLHAAGKKNMTGHSSNNTRKSPHSMTRVSRACQRCRRQKLKVGLYCFKGLCGYDRPAPMLTGLVFAVR